MWWLVRSEMWLEYCTKYSHRPTVCLTAINIPIREGETDRHWAEHHNHTTKDDSKHLPWCPPPRTSPPPSPPPSQYFSRCNVIKYKMILFIEHWQKWFIWINRLRVKRFDQNKWVYSPGQRGAGSGHSHAACPAREQFIS